MHNRFNSLISFIIFYFCFASCFSQSAFPINKKDERGKKDGFWLVYLTDRLIPTKDSTAASYFGYGFYYHGSEMGFMYSCKKERRTASKIVRDEPGGKRGAPVLLNGNFKFYDKNGRLSISHSYLNGLPKLMEGFTFRAGKLTLYERITFSETQDDEPGSYSYKRFDSDSTLLSALYFRKKMTTGKFRKKNISKKKVCATRTHL